MSPRIFPMSADERTETENRALGPLASQTPLENVFATFVRHPDLFRRFSKLAGHVLFASSLDSRRREIAILRIGWRNGCRYEFAAHQELALQSGLTKDEIRRIAWPGVDEQWQDDDALVLRVVDELFERRTITDATWAQLAESFSTHQMMDLVFTVGTYNLVSWSLNSFQVEVDHHFPDYPWSGE